MRKLLAYISIATFYLAEGCTGSPTASAAFIPATYESEPTTVGMTPSLSIGLQPSIWIERHPPTANYSVGKLSALPTFDLASEKPFQVDLRGADLSELDLRNSLKNLLYADFDDKTIWPPSEMMPVGFDPERIMELGRNPGLGIRDIHKLGITGRNVGIAIIDQVLLVDHSEYANQVRLYEEINLPASPSSMHGPAVASIAVGKTTGVAPEASLYYIAANVSDPSSTSTNFVPNYKYLAQAVHRILEINRQLPDGQKIRVISMSIGWQPDAIGTEEINAATDDAKAAGLLVVSGSINMTRMYGIKLFGLGRPLSTDPDNFDSYGLGVLWTNTSPEDPYLQGNIFVPMDSRTTASWTGIHDHVFFSIGGGSWTMPYLAGIYALAAQVQPTITPEKFLSLAIKTGRKFTYRFGKKAVLLGPVIDPVYLINALKSE
jgi:hypothetical protein